MGLAETSALSNVSLWQAPATGRVSSPSGTRINPVTGRREFHDGIDIAIPLNTPVVAPRSGEVIASGFCNGYGNFIRIAHDSNYTTFYAHLNSVVASAGETVTQGERIAYSGNTGQSTGPHLHFGVFNNGQFVDPLSKVTP